MIEQLLPEGTASAALWGAGPDAEVLPQEEIYLRHAVFKRRREFTMGRLCARRSLAGLGLPEVPILCGAHREPLWPAGVIGSITHCRGYCAAAVARSTQLLAIGIDAEPHQRLPDGLLEAIGTYEERRWIAQASPEIRWDRLLFCAKESLYKAWFPVTAAALEFEQARIQFQPANDSFAIELLGPPAKQWADTFRHAHGRYQVRDGIVLATLIVPHPHDELT